MAQIPKGRLVKGPYKPICRDCAIYFSTTVNGWFLVVKHNASECFIFASTFTLGIVCHAEYRSDWETLQSKQVLYGCFQK